MDFMMTRSQLEELLIAYEESPVATLFEWDTRIFTFLMRYYAYGQKDQRPMPDKLLCFMEIDSWQGMSQRCGVWQYYERLAFERDTRDTVLSVLKDYGEEETARIYAYGIHEYDDPKYTKDGEYDYPEEWFAEAETIDDWIDDNNDFIYSLKRSIILDNKEVLLDLVKNI